MILSFWINPYIACLLSVKIVKYNSKSKQILTDVLFEAFYDRSGGYIMGVGNITSMNSMSGIWKTTAGSSDVKSKTIQNQITEKQQQMQKISSEKELSANEKANERKQQQKEIVNLNMELKRHQDEFLRSQKRELMMAELQDDSELVSKENPAANAYAEETAKSVLTEKESQTTDADISSETIREKMPAATLSDTSAQQAGSGAVIFKSDDGSVILKDNLSQNEKNSVDSDKTQTDETQNERIDERETNSLDNEASTGLSRREIYEIVSNDASAQQTGRQETVIARIEGGIAVLKGELEQDRKRGINTDKKQAELEKLEQREERARALQISALKENDAAIKSPAKVKVSGIQDNAENDVIVNTSKLPKTQGFASQQKFKTWKTIISISQST